MEMFFGTHCTSETEKLYFVVW